MDWILSLANLPEGLFLLEYKVFRDGLTITVFGQYLSLLP